MRQPFLGHGAVAPALALAVLFAALPERAGAAGFEKTVGWSGRYAALADAATADVSGPEALYFNPAGLAGASRGAAVLDLSPAFGKSRGQLPSGSTAQPFEKSTARRLIPLAGALASYPLSPRWGVGIGYYVAGGMQAFYEDIDYRPVIPTATLRPTIKADVQITELAIGAGCRIAPGWRAGAAWRILHATADLATVRILSPQAFQNVFFNDLEDTAYSGVRLGVQYQAPDRKWGAGAAWRSQVKVTGRGTASANVDVGGTVAPIPESPVSVKNALPQQVSLGAFCAVSPALRILGEYAWTEYSVDRVLDVSGSLGGVSLDTAGDIPQHWQNMHVVRVGAEYSGVGAWRLRGGYAYTSRVTARGFARATFVPPAPAHTFALGAGRPLSGRATLDVALDYSVASGTGSNASDNVATGTFRSDAITVHAGLTYAF